MRIQEYLIALNMVQGLASLRIKKLLVHFSDPRNIFKASIKELASVDNIGTILAQRIRGMIDSVEFKKELRQISNLGIKVITIADKDYPLFLKQIYDPPPVLYIQGNLSVFRKPAVAIVGCRRASYYGLRQAERLATALSAREICIVSGFARGIDTAAHKGALVSSGNTIAVLGSGFMHLYPPENKALLKEVVKKGAIISEFALEVLPLRGNFPRRNRIISGLSQAVVVVEAARRSGSLITADLALSQGRDVFAVPGAANTINAQGTNKLIREGAKLVEKAEDIIEELEIPINESKKRKNTAKIKEDVQLINCNQSAEKILQILSYEPLHIDSLVKSSNLSFSCVYKGLLELQLKGLVKEIEGKKFIKKGG